MKHIACDIDGVLSSFVYGFSKRIIQIAGVDRFPTGWKDNPEFPSSWDWVLDHGYSDLENHLTWKTIKEDQAFWENLRALPGCLAVLKQLNELAKLGHEVYFFTYRVGDRCKLQTENWLWDHGMTCPTVIVCKAKGQLVKEIGIDIFIDDHLETANAVAYKAHEEELPVEGHVYLKDAGYNRQYRREDLIVVKDVEEMLRKENLWSQ